MIRRARIAAVSREKIHAAELDRRMSELTDVDRGILAGRRDLLLSFIGLNQDRADHFRMLELLRARAAK